MIHNTGVSTTKKVKIENDLEVTGVTTSTGGFGGNSNWNWNWIIWFTKYYHQ